MKAEWVTGTVPVYVEGIPAGTYLLEETKTPSGFVTGEPKAVEIGTVPEVQTFFLCNDHTKVEFEKYVWEGREKKILGGAEFVLYETGNYETSKEEEPVYGPDQVVDRWVSSDREEFRGFMEAFEAMYRDFGTEEGTTVQWEQGGSRHVAKYMEASSLDASVSGGEKTRHPLSAVLLFGMEDGRQIRITISGEDSFEYQFDYRRLLEVNSYACSYVTADGVRRIDYLPAKEAYVLVETQVPEGYAKAADRLITVKNISDVQRYLVENMEGKLTISKEAEGQPGELAKAFMELYRAGEDGRLVTDIAHLKARWITGEDGVYTEEDFVNGRIPAGYKKGDLRPHEIRRLDDGIYWLVEQKSPQYYTLMEPVRIDYHQQEEIQVVRVYNRPAKGDVEVTKADLDGNPLAGAVFELAAYKKEDMRNPVWTRQISDDMGIFRVEELPIGEVLEDGRIEPYLYKLKEMVPPDGYAVSTQIFTWEFEPDTTEGSYRPGQTAEKEIQVTDKKTCVSIGKRISMEWAWRRRISGRGGAGNL